MSGNKILIFMCSVRPVRMVDRVAIAVKNLVASHGMEPELLDPAALPFEVVKVPLHFMKEPAKEAPQWMLETNQKILNADGFIIVSAEYNCGIPPALSNMLDHFPPASFRHRPCGIITYSPGPFGGVRATIMLRPFVTELGMFSVPFTTSIPEVHLTIQEDGKVTSEKYASKLDRLVREVGWYADAIKKHKEIAPVPE